MNHNVAQYKNKLKKKLRCSRNTRAQLMDDFERSLDKYLEENPEASFDDLSSAFGPPDEMAKVLMEKGDASEKRTCIRNQLLLRIAAVILVVLLVLVTIVVFYLKQRPLVVDTNSTIDETFYVPYIPTGGE